jgi:hypothetical protein
MVRHIVCWKLKDHAEGRTKQENALLLQKSLMEMKDMISQIREIEVGIDIAEVETNWDLVLNSTFDNAADLDIYQKHPAHQEFKELVMKLRDLRACVDYEF